MTKNNKTSATPKKSNSRSNIKYSGKTYDSGSRSLRLIKQRPFMIITVLIFAALGSWLIVGGHALTRNDSGESQDNVARGLIYNGRKEAKSGQCKGAFETDSAPVNGKLLCSHPDPGPEGVDLRDRTKKIDAELDAQVAKDAKVKPLAADANEVSTVGAADVGTVGSLGNVSPVSIPCTGTGTDGYRVQMIYAYASGGTNRISYVRSGFQTIANRINAVFHNSGVATGSVRNVHFATSAVTSGACTLSLPAVAITGNIDDVNNLRTQLRAKGYNSTARKYLVELDGGTSCGWGDLYNDGIPTQDNANNSGNLFAFVWHPCWNYAEPHETMHTMGAVQIGAPYGTSKFHCYDQHDVMCYNDGSGAAMIQRCTNTVLIWRFDCGYDTYFRATGATGWLSTHWNTANNRFLSH